MASARSTLRWARRRMLGLPEVPRPWDLRVFVDRVAQQRGRPIDLVPLPMSAVAATLTGLWIRYDERDTIVYDTAGSELHRSNVVLHELAHMLSGHEGMALGEQGLLARGGALPDTLEALSADPRVRVLHRSAYSDAQEREAETLAFTIWQAAQAQLVRPGTGTERLVTAFEQW